MSKTKQGEDNVSTKSLPTIARLFAEFDNTFLLIRAVEQNKVTASVMQYAFQQIDSATMSRLHKEVLGWSGTQCIEFRKILASNGMIQKNIKLYLYSKMCSQGVSRVSGEDFGLRQEDILWAKRFLLGKAGESLVKSLSRHFKTYKPMSLETYDRYMSHIVKELRTTAVKYVAKKFVFLTQSSQEHKEDLVNTFLEAAIYHNYKSFPFVESLLHMKNIGIRAIHNRGVNILVEQTTKSRNRVMRNEDGTFSGLTLSLNQSLRPNDAPFVETTSTGGICTSMVTGLHGSPVRGERVEDVNRQYDLAVTLDRLLENKKQNEQKFVRLLMGDYDPEFSGYLGSPNDEAQMEMGRLEYADAARRYCGLPVTRTQLIVRSLRTELADFRN